MATSKIKKGDTVRVIAGKDKDKEGKVTLVDRKSGKVTGAVWHGKVTTALLYLTILVHLLWPHIPAAVSNGLIMLCVVVMLVSWSLYIRHNYRVLSGKETSPKKH